MAKIVSTGQKLVQLDKEYIHSDWKSEWSSDTKIWMSGGQGGDLSVRNFSLI